MAPVELPLPLLKGLNPKAAASWWVLLWAAL